MSSVLPVKLWFEYPNFLRRFILDFISDEVTKINDAAFQTSAKPKKNDLIIGDQGLGLDSLDIMGLSSSLARTIHLHESSIDDNFLNEGSVDGWLKIVLSSLQVFSERISFKTSGSTGLRKYYTHQINLLDEEAAFLSTILTNRYRVLCAIPSHHIYGFIFSILLPRYLGSNIEIVDIRAKSPNSIISIVKPNDLILGFPEFWKFFAEIDVSFPDGIIGVNSSGPCPEQVGLSLLEQGLSTFFEVYGSSETAGIGWREHPSTPYRLFPFWNTQSESEYLARIDPTSEKLSRFKLQDNLEWFSSNTFNVCGRKDGVIQIGGINVSLSHVSDTIKKHPAVKEVTVRMMRPDEGDRLKAFVVLHNNNDHSSLISLNEYISKELPAHERPKSITTGSKLPVNKIGKLSDWSIFEEY